MPRGKSGSPPDAKTQHNILVRSLHVAAAANIKTLAAHAARFAAAPIQPPPDAIEHAMAVANADPPDDVIHCPVADFDRRVVDALRHLSESVRALCPDDVITLERHASGVGRKGGGGGGGDNI